jgi:two-component system sensor histidine kinase BaeS
MRSLRSRLFVAMALIASVSVALTVAIAVVAIHHRDAVQAKRTLDRQASALASVLAPTPSTRVFAVAIRPGSSLGGVRKLGARRAAKVIDAIGGRGSSGSFSLAGHQLLFAASPVRGGAQIVVVRSATLASADVVPLTLSLLVAALGGVLLAALLSLLVARRVTDPLGKLERAAARLPREPGVRVELEEPRELASLAAHFNEMAAELERSREEQRSFLLSVSHELKTPLTAIRGYAEGLADGAVAAKPAAEVIGVETQRLERLIGDLLDLARLGRADFRVALETVDLGGLAESALARFASTAAARRVRINLTIKPDATALADHDRLMQVISNLLENALRMTPSGGTITLAAGPGALSVTDSGPGINPTDLPHAFERFYLHRRAGNNAGHGSGLGLAIVAELVGAMGGHSSVASAPGEGARFEVNLPHSPNLR